MEHLGLNSVQLRMNKTWFLVTAAGLTLLAGCTPRPQASTSPPSPAMRQPTALTEAQVLASAREAVATNDTWLERAEFEAPKRQADGSWTVWVWRLPKTPGGHRIISISEEGQVISYFRGR
jgi:hypothetical protein